MNPSFIADDFFHITISVCGLELLHLFRFPEMFLRSPAVELAFMTEVREIAGILFDGHLHCHFIKRAGVVEGCSIFVLGSVSSSTMLDSARVGE